MLSSKAMMGAPAAVPQYIEDVFSTYLYTGTSSNQVINNGIDLAGKGGLVWQKIRNLADGHRLNDTARPINQVLVTNDNGPQGTEATSVTAFNNNGFTAGTRWDTYNVASWTFRKAPKFFDVVTYTGNGANRTIAHNLGSVPGMIIVKRTDVSGNWAVYHRSLTATKRIFLNQTEPQTITSVYWNDTAPTSTVFSLGTDSDVNASGSTYVAYLFAHDAGGFGEAGDQNVVSCGTYNGNGSAAGRTITLGYEPQWLMIKNAAGTGNWQIIDNMRGMPVGSADATLQANLSNAESAVDYVSPLATGFQITSTSSQVNTGGEAYIYLAIRRGPMKTPTVGTSVFVSDVGNGSSTTPTYDSTFPVDLGWSRRPASVEGMRWYNRLTGTQYLVSNDTAFAGTDSWGLFDSNVGWYTNAGTNYRSWMFRRAPGFFDVVCYTGTGANQTVNHGLGVTPEILIVKKRASTAGYWNVKTANLFGWLNTNNALQSSTTYLDNLTSTSFFAKNNGNPNFDMSEAGNTYVAYLFATVPNVSKVGSYTGTGTTLQVNCGFTTGARFVLIKRTDSTGSWYVWDSARGIVAGNDPYLLLNSTAAEVTNTDYVDALASGFEISSTAPAEINASGGTFVFLAVA